jgi:hypothetical protein
MYDAKDRDVTIPIRYWGIGIGIVILPKNETQKF